MSAEIRQKPRRTSYTTTASSLSALAVLIAVHGYGLYTNELLGRVPLVVLLLVSSDVFIGFIIFLILRDLLRSGRMGFVVSLAVPAGFMLASQAKLSILGMPGSVHDVFLIKDLLAALPDIQRWAALAGLAVMAFLFVRHLQLRQPSLLCMAFVVSFVGLPAVAVHDPNVSRHVSSILPRRGSAFPVYGHFVNAWIEFLEKTSFLHNISLEDYRVDFDLIAAAPGDLRIARRNVQFVFIESFVDPLWFPNFPWPAEPLSPLFARWRESSGARTVSPSFGARSTNVEFEALCGIPAAVDGSTIVFLHVQRGQALPCLPRILSNAGFQNLSVIAEGSEFLNGRAARGAIGFTRLVFRNELDMSDSDGIWLSASATLDQTELLRREMSQGNAERPLFSYVFITAGHTPYERNKVRRPDALMPHPGNSVVRDWANGAYYNAIAVERFVADLRRSDPDALIVILGDHGPLLGANFAGYLEGGRLERSNELPPLQQQVLYETPLLILDRDQLLQLGRLPTWQLPEVVLNILSEGEYCARLRCAFQRERRLRPFYDVAMLIEPETGETALCHYRELSRDASCDQATREARALQTILARMLAGQHPAPTGSAEPNQN